VSLDVRPWLSEASTVKTTGLTTWSSGGIGAPRMLVEAGGIDVPVGRSPSSGFVGSSTI
jgi:hypothetical protein